MNPNLFNSLRGSSSPLPSADAPASPGATPSQAPGLPSPVIQPGAAIAHPNLYSALVAQNGAQGASGGSGIPGGSGSPGIDPEKARHLQNDIGPPVNEQETLVEKMRTAILNTFGASNPVTQK